MARIAKMAVQATSRSHLSHLSWSPRSFPIISSRATYKDRKKEKISNFEITGTARAFTEIHDKRYLQRFSRPFLSLNRPFQVIFCDPRDHREELEQKKRFWNFGKKALATDFGLFEAKNSKIGLFPEQNWHEAGTSSQKETMEMLV